MTDQPEVTTLTREQLARRWGYSPGTLANWAVEGYGPPIFQLRGRVRYFLHDIQAWEQAHMKGQAS